MTLFHLLIALLGGGEPEVTIRPRVYCSRDLPANWTVRHNTIIRDGVVL
jgi:hypothetical protein